MQTSRANWARLGLLLLILLFALFMYTFLHEGGHALAGWAFGAQLRGFNVNFFNNSAHVRLAGDSDVERWQRSIVDVAGVGLPLLSWLLFILLAPRRANPLLELLKWAASLTALNTLLAWIVLPWFSMIASAPADDVIRFLANSGWPPWLLSLGGLALYLAGWRLHLHRSRSWRDMLAWLHSAGPSDKRATVRTLLALGLVFALSALAALALNAFGGTSAREAQQTQAPAGYELALVVDLGQRSYQDQLLLEFDLEASQAIGLFLLLKDVDSDLLDLSLTSTGDVDLALFHAEAYSANHDSIRFEKDLPAGRYQLRISSRSSSGILEIYTRSIRENGD